MAVTDRSKYRKDWYEKNRERTLAVNKKWREENTERMTELHRIWRNKNKQRAYEATKRWRAKNKDRIREKLRLWRQQNQEKIKQYKRDDYHKNKDEILKRRILNKYKLTKEEYESLVRQQRGKCCICRKEKLLCVDHCHRTNKIRGLLCKTCNSAIGMLEEKTLYLKRAIEYLKASKTK